jgi:hypothetical protein
MRFGPAAGMLLCCAAVAEERGATLHRHPWSRQPPSPFEPEIARFLDEIDWPGRG